MVGSKEVAQLLRVTERRVRYLLEKNRIQGAIKIAGRWIIPLIDGLPKIDDGKRGPKPTWKERIKSHLENLASSKSQKKGKTYIHIYRQRFGKKDKNGNYQPAIIVRKRNSAYCHKVFIPGPCTIVYNFDNPICGAKAWIETLVEPIILDS
ncbi:MAG: helix-turn-helix domain-containing protein [Methylacidiphilales bacterium]|nr:helix-turn-helix domain-containing protein [Candidatus Methylacidiphilales bacterium]